MLHNACNLRRFKKCAKKPNFSLTAEWSCGIVPPVMFEDEDKPLFLSPELKYYILKKYRPENVVGVEMSGITGNASYTATTKDGFKITVKVWSGEKKCFEDLLIPDILTLQTIYSPETGMEYKIGKNISFWSFRMRKLLWSIIRRYYRDIAEHCAERERKVEEEGKRNLKDFLG